MDRRSMLTLMAGATAAGGAGGRSDAAPRASAAHERRPSYAVARDGTRLFCRSWGDGPPILFVAAIWLTSQAWQYQMASLCDAGFRCVAFDRRGHGRSDDPGGGYDMDTLADDIAAVADHYDLRDMVLVGHSMGGAECVRYLTRHGGARVRRLALIAPVTPCLTKSADNPEGLDPRVFEALRATIRKDFPGAVRANIRPFFEPSTSDGMVDWIVAMMNETSMQATLACNHAFTSADFRPELPRIALPTLVIQGDKDASAPIDLTGRRTAALIPGARMLVYKGAPHGLIFTRMERLNADLAAFARA